MTYRSGMCKCGHKEFDHVQTAESTACAAYLDVVQRTSCPCKEFEKISSKTPLCRCGHQKENHHDNWKEQYCDYCGCMEYVDEESTKTVGGCVSVPSPPKCCTYCNHLEAHHDKNTGECETCRAMVKSGAVPPCYYCTGNYGKKESTDWDRNRLLEESRKQCERACTLMEQRNKEYAKENDPFQNFRRLRLLSLVQEMDNVVCRLYNYADAEYKGIDKPVSSERMEDFELDLINFVNLYHCLRLELEGV